MPGDDACKNYKFIRLCPTCNGANKAESGNVSHQSPEMCLFNRLCVLASAKIQFYRLMNKNERYFTYSNRKILKSILIIQNDIFSKKYFVDLFYLSA